MGGQGLGHGAGGGGRGGLRLPAVHRRRHRLRARHGRRPGPRRGHRRPCPGVPDGAAARGHRLGEVDSSGLCLLFRPALPVPQDRAPGCPDRRGRWRLHAGAPDGPGGRRGPGPDQGRQDRRHRPGAAAEAAARGRPLLAGIHHARAQPAALPEVRRTVGDGGAQRLHPAPLLAGAARRGAGRAGVALPAAARGRPRRAGGPGGGRGPRAGPSRSGAPRRASPGGSCRR